MTAAEDAYAAATREIARVKEEGIRILELSQPEFRALDRLPPEIADLPHLRTLNLRNTQISDLTPIAGLAALRSLQLDKTQVSDLSPITGLTALEQLTLNNTQVSDLTPIAGLKALERLWLDNTRVSDVTPITDLTALELLDLDNTQVSDLRPIADLSALGTPGFGLFFSNTPFADATEDTRRLADIEVHKQRTE